MRKVLGIVAIALGLVMVTGAWAQDYPARPVKMLIPYPPGGSTDLMGRLIARGLERKLGKPVVVENRPGASGIIGTGVGARSDPDGYTIVFVDQSLLATHPHVHKNLDYQPLTDFAPVTQVARFPMTFVVHSDVPTKTLLDFIALAKSRGEPMTYASIGPGSPHQLIMERFKRLTGINLTHVPYTGGGPATRAVAAGEVQSMMTGMTSFAGQIKSGSVRPLAVASRSRVAAFPDIPTFAEAGIKDFDTDNWFGIVVPAQTNKHIIARLNKEIREVLESAEIREKFTGIGVEPYSDTSEQFANHIKQEYESWGRFIKEAKLQLD